MNGYPEDLSSGSGQASRQEDATSLRARSSSYGRPGPLGIPPLPLFPSGLELAKFMPGSKVAHESGRLGRDGDGGASGASRRNPRRTAPPAERHRSGIIRTARNAPRTGGDAGARAPREHGRKSESQFVEMRSLQRAGVHSQTPKNRESDSVTSRRTSSVDTYSPGASQPWRQHRFRQEEWPHTKHFLQREIEARSQKISANWRNFRRESETLDSQFVQPWRKLFVVCAKLPFTIIWTEETGTLDIERNQFEANLAEILQAEIAENPQVLGKAGIDPEEVIMVGAPVVRRASDRSLVTSLDDFLQQELLSFLSSSSRMKVPTIPVFLPPGRSGFADQVIFPLFHYTPPSMETGIGLYDWDGYELVNELFCSTVLKTYSRNDLVLINDYPLMLLPKLLRKERPDICIGFYIHCVFPSSEVYRILPQREHLLRGVLSSNVIGFHNFQYVRHFLTASTRILGCECTANGIEACEDAGGTSTKVIAVPLGIDLEPYHEYRRKEETKNRILEVERLFPDKKILMAVDRLEEKKGIPHKIMAFHKFLQKSPSWAEQVVFVQLVEASDENEDGSEEGEERKRLLQQVYQMGGECNSAFGSIGHLPFHFLYADFSKVDLMSLMVKADVFMDTPLRDTLSQEAHGFVWCQEDDTAGVLSPGVLILSEFSGSAQSLRAAAICVNPWDTNAFADAMQEALEMDISDRRELHIYGNKHVFEHTLRRWASNFLDEIVTAESECEDERLQIPPYLDHDQPVAAVTKASKRVFIFGFSGTLLPRKAKIQAKILPKLSSSLLSNLQAIAEEPNTQVIVISGLEKRILSQAVGNVPCWIIAEGGVCYREPDGNWCNTVEEQLDKEWLGPVKEIMEYFAARTPGSNVIETSSSVSWHYQKTQGDHAAIQSKDLLIHLWAGPLLSAPAEVIVGNDSVSVRPTGVSKAWQLEKILTKICSEDGATAPSREWLSGDAAVICISDLITKDEDVFVALQKFFECDSQEQRKLVISSPNQHPQDHSWHRRHREEGDNLARTLSVGAGGESWLSGIGEHRADRWAEEANLEANSKSLGSLLYGRLNLARTETLDSEEGPFGLHKGLDEVGIMKKTPSEPELPILHNEDLDGTDDEGIEKQVSEEQALPEKATVITCTVSRKPTRAMYHLSDTTDVAFLVARIAREIRQAKQVSAEDPQ